LENNPPSLTLRWATLILGGIYKLLVLGALVWIGFGLQDVANALYTGSEACVVDPDASDSSTGNDEPGVIKPLLRGAM